MVPELDIPNLLCIPKIEAFSVKQIQFLIAKIVFLCLCLSYQPAEFIEFAASAATLQEIIFQGPTSTWWMILNLFIRLLLVIGSVLFLFIKRNHWYFQRNKFGQGNDWMCHICPSLSSWSTKPKRAESSLWSTRLRSTIWISLRTSIWFGLRTSIGLTLTGRGLTDVAQHWIRSGSSWQAISKCTLRRMKGNKWGRR